MNNLKILNNQIESLPLGCERSSKNENGRFVEIKHSRYFEVRKLAADGFRRATYGASSWEDAISQAEIMVIQDAERIEINYINCLIIGHKSPDVVTIKCAEWSKDSN